MDKNEFVEKFGSVFEHSPWVAERAYDPWTGISDNPLSSDAVHRTLVAAFRNASEEEKLEVLKAHPDLAGKLAQAKRLTEASTSEQASAGLDALTDEERTTFTELNDRYLHAFGFPFIIAVRDHTKTSILTTFRRRVGNDRATEFEEACSQVERIAYHRLRELLPGSEQSADVSTISSGTYFPAGGLPRQNQLMTDRAVFTDSYAVIPRRVMTDIVVSYLPHWQGARAWVLARPLSGFSETFSQSIVELSPGGGSDNPEQDMAAQAIIYVVRGEIEITHFGVTHKLEVGGYAYLPAGKPYSIRNASEETATFHWFRKQYQAVDGIEPPDAFFTHERDATTISFPYTNNAWATTRFVDPEDLRHDMHVNVVTFKPGGCIPFAETHVMEHGIYILEGKAVYRLNQDWVEVEAGDFIWLRAFCPQGCYAGGPSRFRYLLYKDVNRHPTLNPWVRNS